MPNNDRIIKFFLEYGLWIVVFLLAFWIIKAPMYTMFSVISGECVITKSLQQINIEGTVWKVKDIDIYNSIDKAMLNLRK